MKKYPYIVIEESGVVRGYAYAEPFVARAAYDHSCEITIYLDRGATGRGFGRILYEALEKRLSESGILNMYACIGYPEEDDEYLTKCGKVLLIIKFYGHTICSYRISRS